MLEKNERFRRHSKATKVKAKSVWKLRKFSNYPKLNQAISDHRPSYAGKHLFVAWLPLQANGIYTFFEILIHDKSLRKRLCAYSSSVTNLLIYS